MQASDYLRAKFQSDRQLAITSENAIGGVLHSVRGVASDIYSGIERASWYSSCFVPQYSNVCQELKSEEIRTIYSVESIFRYRDVIQHMLYLYFEQISNDVGWGNQKGSARRLVVSMTGAATHMAVGRGTRNAFAAAASVALANSGFMSQAVVARLSGKMPAVFLLMQFYGIQQKCALAARHLKALDPEYYWVLYQAKLEMLYYFVEPVLAEVIKRVKSGYFINQDDLTDFIRRTFDV